MRDAAGVEVFQASQILMPPTKRDSTLLEVNNLKNSLKSGGGWVVAIDDLALEFHGSEAGGGGLGVLVEPSLIGSGFHEVESTRIRQNIQCCESSHYKKTFFYSIQEGMECGTSNNESGLAGVFPKPQPIEKEKGKWK